MRHLSFFVLAVILWCLPVHAENRLSAPSYLGERLVYQVSYRGALSGQNPVDIADAVLETKSNSESVYGAQAYYTVLEVSTEDYPVLEDVYPFRYSFRSYYSTDLARALYIDMRKISRKHQHELVRFDWNTGRAERYKKRGKATAADEVAGLGIVDGDTASQQGFHHNAKDDLPLSGALLDRLSLLQVVRAQALQPGQAIEFPVSDGKTIYRYRIKVLGQEPLQVDGQVWDTYKLSFDGFVQDNSSGQSDHAPVFIWMTADNHRLPVRFSSEALLGNFDIDLQTINGQPAMELAAKRLATVP